MAKAELHPDHGEYPGEVAEPTWLNWDNSDPPQLWEWSGPQDESAEPVRRVKCPPHPYQERYEAAVNRREEIKEESSETIAELRAEVERLREFQSHLELCVEALREIPLFNQCNTALQVHGNIKTLLAMDATASRRINELWSELAQLRTQLATAERERDALREALSECLATARSRTSAPVHARDDHSQNCGWCKVENVCSAALAAKGADNA